MVMPDLMRRDWTLDDLQALEDDGKRYEIIDGELFVTPSPSWPHQDAAGELYLILSRYARSQRIGHVLQAPADVAFSPRRIVQPDIFVVPLIEGQKPRTFEQAGALLLAAEVLSPSTARADRVAKRRLYREELVAEYWIIDLDARTIERSTPSESRPELLSDQIEWHPPGAGEPLLIELAAYFGVVLGTGA
jgi:Uma2 family endonuclease